METVLLRTCIFLALLYSGTPLSCLKCSASTRSFCSMEEKQDCTENQSCISSALSSTIYGGQRNIAQKRCFASNWCRHANYSFTSVNNTFFHKLIRCCQTDGCNVESPVLPPRKLNRLQCPGCFSTGLKSCSSSEMVKCFDDETQCMAFVGSLYEFRLREVKLGFQGCATPDFCAFASGQTEQMNDWLKISTNQTQCYDAKASEDQG